MIYFTFLSVFTVIISTVYLEPIKPSESVDCTVKCPVDISTDTDIVSFKYKTDQYTCAQCSSDCPVDISVTKECGVAFKYIPEHQEQCVCDEGWSLGPDNQCLKYVGATGYTSSEAREQCGKLGAKLVTIKNKEKQSFVQEFVGLQSIGQNVWLDAIRVHSEDVDTSFAWSDGTGMDYTNWETDGLTRNAGQYCVFFDSPSSSMPFTWHVYDCALRVTATDFKMTAICERPCSIK